MIKLIATDMDGTFLDSNKQFDPEFINIFYKLKEQGIKFVIASGNQYYRLYQKFVPLSEEMYFIAENGCYIAEGSKELHSNTIEPKSVDIIKEVLATKEELLVILCGRKGAYVLKKAMNYDSMIKLHYCNYQYVDSFDDINEDIMKISVYDPRENVMKPLNEVKPLLPKEIKIVTSGNMWMDIHNNSINKGIGIKYLQELYNIKPEECMAFGDQMNDYELLQQVKYSYAMDNAIDPIKDVAYKIVPSNDEQGVIIKIKELLDLA